MALVCTNHNCSYTRVHGPLINSSQRYCECGHELVSVAEPAPRQLASRMARFGGIILDSIIFLPFGLLGFIPIIGPVAVILVWLFRDINGRSPGKVIVGTTIISRHGGPATPMQRVVRNLPFALPLLPLFFPVIGVPVAGSLDLLMAIVENIAVLVMGERIGDKLAGTMVVKRSSVMAAQQSVGRAYEL
jgi:uncharacterized RDD family membrane protein YckC